MIFNKKDNKTKFWNWFLKNQSKLEEFIRTKNSDYSIYNKLTKRLKKFDELLFPEITIDKDNDYVLIITPDGISKGINSTKEIVAAAPKIENWKIKKFRQPSDTFTTNFNGLEFDYEDIKIWRVFNLEREKVDIAVLIKDFDKNDTRFMNLGFLYLDHILGEFNVMTRVGAIEFMSWEQLKEEIESIDLITLRNEISDKLY